MAKITLTLDTETREGKVDVDGKEYDFIEMSCIKYLDGFSARIDLRPVELGDMVSKHECIMAYANVQEIPVKSFSSVKFLDDKQTVAIVESKNLQEKLIDFVKASIK